MRAGLHRLLLSLASGRQARLSILTYHRVHPEPDPLFPGELHAESFDSLCTWLRQDCEVLALDEAVELLQAGRLPRRALAISFDDGYADNHAVALPILRRHGLKASFFITTGFIGNGGCMWNDQVIEAVRGARGAELDLEPLGLGRHALGQGVQRGRLAGQLLLKLKYLPLDERLARCAELVRLAGIELPRDLMMDWDQVRALHAAGMQIGAHTVDHPILRSLDEAALRAQLRDSRLALEREIGAPVRLFAYPNGRWGEDYDARCVAAARAEGFAAAVTTMPGAAGQGVDPMQIPRYTPWDQSRARFMLRLARNLATA